MKLLLDTHIVLWAASDPGRLSGPAAAACADTSNSLWFSVASAWEIQIKVQLGKLSLPQPLRQLLQEQRRRNGLRLLPVRMRHARLPDHHRDPFDRLLVAQAVRDGLTLVSADAAVAAYPVTTLW